LKGQDFKVVWISFRYYNATLCDAPSETTGLDDSYSTMSCCWRIQGPPGWEERKKGEETTEPEGVTVAELVEQYGDDAFYTEVG